jgi:hypothetical protein
MAKKPSASQKPAPGRKVKPGLLYRAKTVEEEAEKKARHNAGERRRRAEKRAEGEARRTGKPLPKPLVDDRPVIPMAKNTNVKGKQGFQKGNSGRPKGARDRKPRNLKASVKTLIEDVVANQQPTLRRALMNGLRSSPRFADKYLRICAEYTDGTPEQSLKLSGFNPEELENVGASLAKKMDVLVAAVLTRKGTPS